MDTIFLDTNSIRNEKPLRFFGNVKELEKVSNLADIAIPSIVIDEIKRQKRRHLEAQIKKLRENYFLQIAGIDELQLSICEKHIDEHIEYLFSNSQNEFSYKTISLNHDGKLDAIRDFAIKNTPPFNSDSDKGFKDSYIYFTILDFLKDADDDVFLLTNDSLLKQAFNNSDVTVISKVEEYFSYRQEYFKEPYFIGRLNEHFNRDDLTAREVLSSSLNDDENWDVIIEMDGKEVTIIVDFFSKEIIEDD